MKIVHSLMNLNWIAVVLFPLTVLLMEAFWVYPWLIWLGQWQALSWQRPPLSLASLILLLSIAFFATKFLLNQRWSLRWIRLSIAFCSLVAVFAVIRIEYGAALAPFSGQWFVHTGRIILGSFSQPHPLPMALAVGAYLWWRGISRGRSPLNFENIYRPFLVGIAALVILIIVWRASLGAGSLESLASDVAPHVAAFFFCGLAALALNNLQTIQQRTPPEETVRAFNRRWLPILFGVVGSIVLVGIGIAAIFSPEFVALLTRLLNSTLEIARKVLHYLLLPFGYIATALVYAARFIVNLLRGRQPLEPIEMPAFLGSEELSEVAEAQVFSDVAVLAIKWTLFAIIAIVIIFLLAKTISRYQRAKAASDIEELHESLWSWEGFTADLRLFFSMLWQRFRRKRKEAMLGSPVPSWHPEGDGAGMLGIRDIYKHLLWEASQFGITRRRYETPYEYTNRLSQAIPGGSEQLGELTDLYINVRYGEHEAEDKQVNYANRLWKFLKGLLARPQASQPKAD